MAAVESHRVQLDAVCLVRPSAEGGERQVLRSVAAEFRSKELALVRGSTGAGKSTLLYLVAGLVRPTSGEVLADGRAVSRFVGQHRERWRREVGFAFQQPTLVPDLTVQENVMMPMIPRAMALADIRAHAEGALRRLGVAGLAHRPAAELSVGEQQRVGIARALAPDPWLVLADEPSAHQDPGGLELVMAALTAAKLRGAVVLVTSHDARLIDSSWHDRAFKLAGGRLEVRRRRHRR